MSRNRGHFPFAVSVSPYNLLVFDATGAMARERYYSNYTLMYFYFKCNIKVKAFGSEIEVI